MGSSDYDVGANIMQTISIAGNLTKDAELRKTQQGASICSFTVAVTDRSSKVKETYFWEVNYWGKVGEAVSPYLKKGGKVSVSGKFGWREYNFKKILTINCSDLEMQGGATIDSNAAPQNQNDGFPDEIPF